MVNETSAAKEKASAPAAAATAGKSEPTKNKLDLALEAYVKIKKEVGEENVKSFLEAAAVDGSLLNAAGEKKKDGDDDGKKSMATKQGEKREELSKSQDDKFRDTSAWDLKLPSRPAGFEAKYLTENWEMKSIANVDNPTSLKQAAWTEILSTNKAFHGFLVDTDGIFSRARYAAFEGKTAAGKGTEYLPQFEVCDDSSIAIKETTSQLEASMAKNGFSSNAIRASISAGAGKFGFAASTGFNNESHSGHSHGDFEDRKEYTACYTFPRARIFLDEDNIKITDACAVDLKAIRAVAERIDGNKPDSSLVTQAQRMMQAFSTKYGNVFATTFLLGGQLTASRYASAISGSDDTSKRDAMKWSAAVSIDCSFGGMSASGGQERSSNEATHNSESRSSAGLAWAARGGNTLLAASPAAWANSVASFQTWRSFEQDKLFSLPTLITRIIGTLPENDPLNPAGKPDVRTLFDTIEHYNVGQPSISKALGPSAWSGRFKLEVSDGKFVRWDGDTLRISKDRNPSDATVFCAVSADVTDPELMLKMKMLPAQWPMFLPTRFNGTDFEKQDSGVPGIWVSGNGFIHREVYKKKILGTSQDYQDDAPLEGRRICRWSFGKANATLNDGLSPWSPTPIQSLANGDSVKLYCHSYFSGGYRSTKNPPYFAPPVCYDPNEPQSQLRVPKITHKTLKDMNANLLAQPNVEFWKNEGVLKDLFSKDEMGKNSLWDLMETYDQLPSSVTSDSALQIINTMRDLFGLSNRALWDQYSNLINPRPGTTQEYLEKEARAYVDLAILQELKKWAKTYGYTQELTFTVRYV